MTLSVVNVFPIKKPILHSKNRLYRHFYLGNWQSSRNSNCARTL